MLSKTGKYIKYKILGNWNKVHAPFFFKKKNLVPQSAIKMNLKSFYGFKAGTYCIKSGTCEISTSFWPHIIFNFLNFKKD